MKGTKVLKPTGAKEKIYLFLWTILFFSRLSTDLYRGIWLSHKATNTRQPRTGPILLKHTMATNPTDSFSVDALPISSLGNIQQEPRRHSLLPKHLGKSGRVTIPQVVVNGGLDTKFETDPYGIHLHGLVTPEQYIDAITRINDDLRPSRSTAADFALLALGPLMVPLAAWGVRHSGQVRKRKRIIRKSIENFNEENPGLLMRWNRRPESSLTIELRMKEHGSSPLSSGMGVPICTSTDEGNGPLEEKNAFV